MTKSVLYKKGLIFSAILFSTLGAVATSHAIDDSVSSTRKILSEYKIYFSEIPVLHGDVKVYKQIVPKTEGKSSAGAVKHGSYESGNLTMYSQDPRYATINDKPFLDYVAESFDVSDSGPMFSMNSEMVLCWFLNEETMIEVEQSRISPVMSDFNLNYSNRCVENESIEDYWKDVKRDIEIR